MGGEREGKKRRERRRKKKRMEGKGRTGDKKEKKPARKRRGFTEEKQQGISKPQCAPGKKKVLEIIQLCYEILEEPKQFCPSTLSLVSHSPRTADCRG